MEAARYGEPPPPDLVLAWQCGDARLPEAGGVLDQDAELWNRMTTLANVYRIADRITGLHGEQIHKLKPLERVAWRGLIEMGVW